MGQTTLREYSVTLDDSTAGSRKISFLPYKAGLNTFAASGDWTPGAGDFKVAKAVTGSGLGAEASIGTAPTWVNGRVVIILSGTELTCRYLTIRIENAAINSDEIIVETYGNASAMYAVDYSAANLPSNIIAVNGTSQTAGDLAALLATIAGYIDTEVAAIKAKTDNLPSDPADASDIAGAFSTVNSTLATIAAYIDTEVAAIKAKTDNLPASPAAVGSAMTLTAAYDAAKTAAQVGSLMGLVDGAITAAKIAAAALNGKGDWSTYAGGDTSGTTTLLSRLTGTRAGLLDNLDAAISSLTALFTAIKGAGWVAGDNLHAINGAIAGVGGVPGPGASQCTLRFLRNSNPSFPIADADVWLTSDAEGANTVAGTLQTNSAGDVTFMLDVGVEYFAWMQKDGYDSVQGDSYVAVAD